MSDFSKNLSRCALLTALGTALLYLSSAVPSGRLAVVAAAGPAKRELQNKHVSKDAQSLMEGRKQYVYRIGEERKPLCRDLEKAYAGVVNPILLDGDAVGALVMLIPEMGNAPSDSDTKVLSAAAQILSKHIEV